MGRVGGRRVGKGGGGEQGRMRVGRGDGEEEKGGEEGA